MAYTTVHYWRVLTREVAMAVGVLALVFLSFAHKPLDQNDINRALLLADGSVPVFCGSAPLQEGKAASQGSCDACRITAGVALPEGLCLRGQVFAPTIRVGLGPRIGFRPLGLLGAAMRPRAPPVGV